MQLCWDLLSLEYEDKPRYTTDSSHDRRGSDGSHIPPGAIQVKSTALSAFIRADGAVGPHLYIAQVHAVFVGST